MTRAPQPWLILLLALIPAASFWWQNRDIPHFGNLQDDAVYTQCGKSIATGQGYRLLHLPGKPFQIKYPPVYPLIIAAMWRVLPDFPSNLGAIAGLNLISLTFLMAGLWRLLQKFGLTSLAAAILAGTVACLPAYIYLTASVMTEITFTAMFVWSLVWLEAAEDQPGHATRYAAMAGLLAAIAYLTRTAGAPLFLTAPLCFALRRKFRPALAFMVVAAPLPALWQGWTLLHKYPVTDWVTRFYLGYGEMERLTVGLDNLGIVMWQNIDSILTNLGEIFVFGLGHSSAFGHQFSRLIAVAAIIGAVRITLRARRWHYSAFGLVFFLLMVFWHYPPDQRLFVPLAPVLVAGLWTEVRHLAGLVAKTLKSPRPGDRVAATAFAAALAVFALFVVYSLAKARIVDLALVEAGSRADTASQRGAFAKLARTTPNGVTILSDQDVLLSLYTGRTAYRTIVPPRLFYPVRMERVRDEFAGLPDSTMGAWDFVLVSRCDWRHTLDDDDRQSVRRQIAQRSDLDPVWQDDTAILYARRPGGTYRGIRAERP